MESQRQGFWTLWLYSAKVRGESVRSVQLWHVCGHIMGYSCSETEWHLELLSASILRPHNVRVGASYKLFIFWLLMFYYLKESFFLLP